MGDDVKQAEDDKTKTAQNGIEQQEHEEKNHREKSPFRYSLGFFSCSFGFF